MREEESPRESLTVLNSREKKLINEKIDSQWGCEIEKSLVWLLSNRDKLYIADPDIGSIDFKSLRVDKVGLYVATVDEKGVRLSIEGSQLLGPKAKRNVVDINDDDVKSWFRGEDLDMDVAKFKGPVILRHRADFVGCGKVIIGKGILNFVPKARRVCVAD